MWEISHLAQYANQTLNNIYVTRYSSCLKYYINIPTKWWAGRQEAKSANKIICPTRNQKLENTLTANRTYGDDGLIIHILTPIPTLPAPPPAGMAVLCTYTHKILARSRSMLVLIPYTAEPSWHGCFTERQTKPLHHLNLYIASVVMLTKISDGYA